MSLDLYAKIETHLSFKKEIDKLHNIFLERLKNLGVKRVLDIGCGSGDFILKAKRAGFDIEGIDLSVEMIKRASKKGVRAYNKDLCQIDKKYDAAVAIFDVLNYLEISSLKKFLCCVDNVLENSGYFICDINTLYGFEEVAPGAVVIDKEDIFISLDAEFKDDKLITKIVTFKKDKNCFKKESGDIVQYYHEVDDLKVCKSLELIDIDFVSLFSDVFDKAILTYKKV